MRLFGVIVVLFHGGVEPFAVGGTRQGQNYLAICADLFMKRNSGVESVLLPSLPAFSAMIDAISDSGRKVRELIRFGKLIDSLDLHMVGSREGYFTSLAIESLLIPGLNVLEFPGLFECEERQASMARLMRIAASGGFDLKDIRQFAKRSETLSTSELDLRVQAIESSDDWFLTRSLLLFVNQDMRGMSPEILRFISRIKRDISDSFKWHGHGGMLSRSRNLLNQLSRLPLERSSSSMFQRVLVQLSELIKAIASVPEGIVDMTRYIELFNDSLHELVMTNELDITSERLPKAVNELRKVLADVGGEYILLKSHSLSRLESHITDRGARTYLLPDLVTFVERLVVNLIRTQDSESFRRLNDASSRQAAVIAVIVDFSVRVVNDERNFSRVALGELIRQNHARIPTAITFLGSGLEIDVGILGLASTIAQDFGIQILNEYPSLIPNWPVSKKESLSHLIGAAIYFDSAQDLNSHLVELSRANTRRVEQTVLVLGAMVRKGLSGFELVPLINPIEWAIEYIVGKPGSLLFTNWVFHRFVPMPLKALLPSMIGSVPEVNRYFESYTGFPSQFEFLADRVSAMLIKSSGDRLMGRTHWLLSFPKRIMRITIQTRSDEIYQCALRYLDLLDRSAVAAYTPHQLIQLAELPKLFDRVESAGEIPCALTALRAALAFFV